jgi:hypothetical protein
MPTATPPSPCRPPLPRPAPAAACPGPRAGRRRLSRSPRQPLPLAQVLAPAAAAHPSPRRPLLPRPPLATAAWVSPTSSLVDTVGPLPMFPRAPHPAAQSPCTAAIPLCRGTSFSGSWRSLVLRGSSVGGRWIGIIPCRR